MTTSSSNHKYLTTFPNEVWDNLSQTAMLSHSSVNSVIVDAVRTYCGQHAPALMMANLSYTSSLVSNTPSLQQLTPTLSSTLNDAIAKLGGSDGNQ